MPIDFAKLNDPKFQAEAQASLEAKQAAIQAEAQRTREMLDALLECLESPHAMDPFTEDEYRFLRSLERQPSYIILSNAQKKWLEALYSRHVEKRESEGDQPSVTRKFKF